MTKLVLRRDARHARVRQGHPWVFAGELESLPDEAFNGHALPLEDARGRFLGMGIVNTRSAICWRRYSTTDQAWDVACWESAIDAALARRPDEPFRRLVWSEADQLPGLVVDQFRDVLVVQALTLAVDKALPALLRILQARLRPREILIRNDAPSRRLEGLEPECRTHSIRALDPFWAEIQGIWYHLDLAQSQKTGFYLDQRAEHLAVGAMASGRRVLDAFSNQGGFALQCARGGAREVLAVDISAEACAAGRLNAERNQLQVEFLEQNVFDYFTAHRDERFDLIILDPPSFAPNKRALPGALKGYKELHLRAFKLLQPGGILATYCCSHHVDRPQFRAVIEEAAADARRTVQLLRESGQPTDHPVLLNFPESEYLKGFILQVRA